jgi:hypothetical protein
VEELMSSAAEPSGVVVPMPTDWANEAQLTRIKSFKTINFFFITEPALFWYH